MADEDTAPTSSPAEEPTTPAPEATTPESVVNEPVVEAPPKPQTAQIPVSEPLPSEPEPIALASAPAPTQSAPPQTASTTAPVDSRQVASDRLVIARASIQDRKHKKLDKIMETLSKKENITNDEVEKLLHVSDATATRYLSALEKQGKIKQVGKTGIGVLYTKI